jgi:hypothetical protein
VLVTRQPAGDEEATGLTIVNESNVPFKLAQDVPRCAMPVTCENLGLPQPFMPGGGL